MSEPTHPEAAEPSKSCCCRHHDARECLKQRMREEDVPEHNWFDNEACECACHRNSMCDDDDDHKW